MKLAPPVTSESPTLRLSGLTRSLSVSMILLTAIFFALHFVHLSADFPNHSGWMDWSKYTDEGWYGDAAIRHFQLGHWYVSGDFNPAVALPVWPLLEAAFFRITGVSIVAARMLSVGIFGGILLASWFLLRSNRPTRRSSLTASSAVLLLAVSPFCFVFTRLAILEPLLSFLTLLALLVAQGFETGPPTHRRIPGWALLRVNALRIVGLGLLLPAMVLTKTTGLFLIPSVFWILWSAFGFRIRLFLFHAVPAASIGLGIWLGYFLAVVRPHYLLDYRYLFSANAYTGITLKNFFGVLFWTLHGGFWMGRLLYWLALASTVLALARVRYLRSHPLIPALLFWAVGYAAFLAYHNNLQPRYYLVIAVPMTLLVPLVFDQLLLPLLLTVRPQRVVLGAASFFFVALLVNDARQTLTFVLHPQYTFLGAARCVRDYIDEDRRKDPGHNPLVLSISGSDLSLMTGIHSICDDFGTLELGDRVKQYMPGWYVAWNQVDDDKMDAMTPLFRVTRVASFPAMDDPERNLLILYRLDPTSPTRPRARRRKPTPRLLETKVGQQPSTNQLEH